MKTIIRILISGGLTFACFGYAAAQSAARSSKEVRQVEEKTTQPATPTTDPTEIDETEFIIPDRGIPTPPQVDKLLKAGKVAQAITEFEKFKADQKKVSPFNLLYLEMSIYDQAIWADQENSEVYAKKVEEIRQAIINQFPNESETYLLQIEESSTNDEIVELATKAIEADPTNIYAYDRRAYALFALKRTEEACADFEKLPWKKTIDEYSSCKK